MSPDITNSENTTEVEAKAPDTPIAEESSGESIEKKGPGKIITAVIVALAAVIITTVVLLIVMLGGSSPYTPEDVALYSAVFAEKDGVTVDISGLYQDGFSVDLKKRGKCVINIDGDEVTGKWSCENSALTINGGGVKYTGYVSDGVILLQNIMGDGIDMTLKSADASTMLSVDRAGVYYINSFMVNDQKYEGDMLKSAGYGDWYIELNENGSGEALMFGTDVISLIWSDESITCTNGLILPYTFADGVISVDYAGMSSVTFKSDAALDPFSDEGLAGDLKTDSLEPGSLWSGTLVISNHEGEGTLSDGSIPVYGFLLKDTNGKTFFDVCDTPLHGSDNALMSYWVNIVMNSLEPVIGENDGWIYDYWLNSADKDAYTLALDDSTLNLNYHYAYQEESCDIVISLNYAGMLE